MPKKVNDWKGFAKKLEAEPHRWHCLTNVRRSVAGNLRRDEIKPVRLLGGTIRVKQLNGHVDDLGVERGDVWVQWTPNGEDVVQAPPPPLIQRPKPRSEKPAQNRNGVYAMKIPARLHEGLGRMSTVAGVHRGLYVRQIIDDFLVDGSDIDLRERAILNANIPDEVWEAATAKATNEYSVPLRKIIQYELDKRLSRELDD